MKGLKYFFAPACGLLLAVAGGTLMFSLASCSESGEPGSETGTPSTTTTVNADAGFVGAKACAQCHQTEHDSWVGSHHEQAMKPATADNVIGDFNDATFTHEGVTSRFFSKDGKFFVNTDGPDGKNADFEIAYTFGVEPLQQYLIKFPGGKIQALTVCWDSRPEEEGGQRWYHLYPDEKIPHDDALHWTGPNFTWNHMCAECHSTDLHKNYDLDTGTYKTSWQEINVSCEACHGPGKDHVDWAGLYAAGKTKDKGDMGLKVRLKDETRVWVMDQETGIAKRRTPLQDGELLNACARCHSRRSQISHGGDAGVDFLDNYRPSYLTEGLYYPDGQIQDEVYVWGSFIQSKMHMAGVTCMDCHDPHTARVPTTSNQLCAKCHMPSKYDVFEHHHHPPDSPGSSCIECHMPHRNYMVVDPRRDHSLRIPRPDLSLKLGTPNACNNCHTEQSVEWAAENAEFWWGVDVERKQHYGEAFAVARENEPGGDKQLIGVLNDTEQPPIVRGTAVIYLSRYPTRRATAAVIGALKNDEPLVRLAAADALSTLPIPQRIRPSLGTLDDPLRAIRIEAGEALADVPPAQLSKEELERVKAGIEAYKKAQRVSADTAAATMNLGSIAYRLGDADEALKQFERVLTIEPTFYPAYANLASMYTDRGQPDRAIDLLDRGLVLLPNNADLLYAKALVYIRQRDYPRAMSLLGQAYAESPQRPDIAYAYAVALNDAGNPPRAVAILEQTLETSPNDPQTLLALATMSRDARRFAEALKYAKRAAELMPDDPGLKQFVQQLEAVNR